MSVFAKHDISTTQLPRTIESILLLYHRDVDEKYAFNSEMTFEKQGFCSGIKKELCVIS